MAIGDLVIHQIISPYFAQNAFLVTHPASGSALVLDPGFGSMSAIQNLLWVSSCKLNYIFLTHEHIDHIGNLNELRRSANCPVVASAIASRNIIDAKRNLSLFHLNQAYICDPADIEHGSGTSLLAWPGPRLQVTTAQGHTDGSILIELEGLLFTGDTMIKNERTVVKLPTGSRTKLATTLDFIFSTQVPSTTIFAGHGIPFQLSESNPGVHLGHR